MAKKYHINDAGNPGLCKAWEGKCPFGAEAPHYPSKEEAQAAYEATMDDNFGVSSVTEVKLKRRELEVTAHTSAEPDELMAVAEAINAPFLSRRLALALAENPSTPADVLLAARSRTDAAYHEFVALELHPNYPRERMTGEGAARLCKESAPEELALIMAKNDVGDRLADQAHYVGENYTTLALSNVNNKMTPLGVSEFAVRNDEWTIAAASSGRFPTDDDLSGKNKFYTPGRTHEDGTYNSAPVQASDHSLLLAAEHNPHPDRQQAIYNKYRDVKSTDAIRALAKNPTISRELKQEMSNDLKIIQEGLKKLGSSVK